MNFTPAEIDAMSVWQFTACVEGVFISRGGDQQETVHAPTPAEYHDMVERLSTSTRH